MEADLAEAEDELFCLSGFRLTPAVLLRQSRHTSARAGVCTGNPARIDTALLVLVCMDPVLHSSAACLPNPELSLNFGT